MQRPVEFRGWRADGKGWVYGFLVPRGIIQDPHYLQSYWIATGFEDDVYPVKDASIGQFTGILDKTKKKIFDGDILEGGVYLEYVVKWDFDKSGWNITSGVQHHYKIVGNIYENAK